MRQLISNTATFLKKSKIHLMRVADNNKINSPNNAYCLLSQFSGGFSSWLWNSFNCLKTLLMLGITSLEQQWQSVHQINKATAKTPTRTPLWLLGYDLSYKNSLIFWKCQPLMIQSITLCITCNSKIPLTDHHWFCVKTIPNLFPKLQKLKCFL